MSEICATCGLPKEICACQTIEKETTTKLKVFKTKKRFNKWVTLVEGLQGEELSIAAKELKRKLACGGSVKDGQIVLQGDHLGKTIEYLVHLGYPREIIKT
ncbi:MAG TPA: stress response translation initiation inhibitor YciH [Candidatus Norongarragalinales archaeon]|nr:stress response translation initiation inhibitor YciH [Candidatus Norongarragalinales archaeon]